MTQPIRIVHNASSGRVVEVNLEGKHFLTPTRALQHRETHTFGEVLKYSDKGKLPAIDPLPHEIHETVLDFRVNDFRRLSIDNQFFAYQKRRIKQLSNNGNKRFRICNIRLVSQDRPIESEWIHMATILQANSESLDMITIPDPNFDESSGKDLQESLVVAQRALTDIGKDNIRILPLLDMKTDPLVLRNKLQILLDSGFISVGIRFRAGHEPSARQIALTLSDKDMWIHLAGVPLRVSQQPIIPQIHLMPFFSFDSISSFKGFGAPRNRENELRMPTVPDRKDPDPRAEGIIPISVGPTTRQPNPRFDSISLGFLTKNQHRQRHGVDLHCNCFLCRNHDLESFYEDYSVFEGRTSVQKLKNHLLIHELYASYLELQNSQKFIEESDYRNYLREKPVIRDYGSTIDDIDMTNLTDFL